MKKNYSILIISFLLFSFIGFSQNLMMNGDLELWDSDTNPTSWDKAENVAKEATEVHGGSFSAAHMSADGTQDLQQNVSGIVAGQQYTIKYYFKDNDPAARTRIWSYWTADGSTLPDNEDELRPGTYSEDNPDWQEVEMTLIAPPTADGFRFEVRVYKQDGQTGGKVYYDDFSVEGTTTNFPEPTNYPTNFTATASGLSIALEWTDSEGEQLPSAYLIKGHMGIVKNTSLEAPVDGVPEADDLDWSDGTATVNVAYGVGEFVFNELEAGGLYFFEIYPYTNVGENIDYKTDGEVPEAVASVENIVTINYEDFNDGTLGSWTEYSVAGDQKWVPDDFGGEYFVKMSGYSGGPLVNEDWLISPLMDLTGYIDVNFSFKSAMNYDGEPLQLFYSQDYDGSGDPNGFTWTELTQDAVWSEGGWEWTESGEIDLGIYANPGSYLAFKYTSNDTEASTWELDNLFTFGTTDVGTIENEENLVRFYPNPASDQLNLAIDQNGELSIVNLNGQVVVKENVLRGLNTMSVSDLTHGLYMIRFMGEDGKLQSGKLLVR